MILFGSGTSSNNLTVSAYGSGALPIIDGSENPSFIGINIYDSSYVTVSNVAIENAGLGILINDVTNETGFTFLGLDLSGNSEGIQSPAGSGAGTVSNVLIQDVVGSDNTMSCSDNQCSGGTLDLGQVSNVVVNRLYSYGNCGETGWGLGSGATNVIVENSESVDDAACSPPEGSTANYIDNDSNVTFVNDSVTDVACRRPR